MEPLAQNDTVKVTPDYPRSFRGKGRPPFIGSIIAILRAPRKLDPYENVQYVVAPTLEAMTKAEDETTASGMPYYAMREECERI